MNHVVLIPFTGIGLQGGFRGDVWYSKRIEIFKNYTLKSLANQTNKDFIIWCTFRPQEITNPLTAEIRRAILDVGLQCVFTYNGPPFHDDKFGGSLWDKTKNAARVVRSCYRNKTMKDLIPNIFEIFQDKNSTLPQRLQRSLDALKPHLKEGVLLTRIDSDDMFEATALEKIQASVWSRVCMSKGYIYNVDTEQLAEYNPKTNPPFYSLFFRPDQFFDATKHIKHYRGFKSHEDITCEDTLEDRLYCVTVRNDPKTHISTTFDHPYRGELIGDILEKQRILSSFGL